MCNFATYSTDWYLEHFQWNCPHYVNTTGLHRWCVNIGSGNGLVPSGTTNIAQHWFGVTAWCHQAISLTHLPLDKMAAILADDNFKCLFLNKKDGILIWISLKNFPRSPTNNKPALVQVMAWHRTGDKPLPGPMLTQFTDAYMRKWVNQS